MQSCVVCWMWIGKMKRDSRIGGYVAKWHMRSFCCVSWCCLRIKCILFIRSYRLDCLVHVQDEHLWVKHELPSFFSDITEFCNVFPDPKNKVHWHPTMIQCFVAHIISGFQVRQTGNFMVLRDALSNLVTKANSPSPRRSYARSRLTAKASVSGRNCDCHYSLSFLA